MYHWMRSHSATIIPTTYGNVPNHWRASATKIPYSRQTWRVPFLAHMNLHEATTKFNNAPVYATFATPHDKPYHSNRSLQRGLHQLFHQLLPITSAHLALNERTKLATKDFNATTNLIYNFFISTLTTLIPLYLLFLKSHHTAHVTIKSWISLKTSRCNHLLPPTPDDGERSPLHIRNDNHYVRFSNRWRKLLINGLLHFHANHVLFNLKTKCLSITNFSRWSFVFPPQIWFELRTSCVNTTHWQFFVWMMNFCFFDANWTEPSHMSKIVRHHLWDLSLSLVPFFPPPLLKDCQFSVTLVGLVAAVQRTPSSPSTKPRWSNSIYKKKSHERNTPKQIRSNVYLIRRSWIPSLPSDLIIWKMTSPPRFRSNFRSHPHELTPFTDNNKHTSWRFCTRPRNRVCTPHSKFLNWNVFRRKRTYFFQFTVCHHWPQTRDIENWNFVTCFNECHNCLLFWPFATSSCHSRCAKNCALLETSNCTCASSNNVSGTIHLCMCLSRHSKISNSPIWWRKSLSSISWTTPCSMFALGKKLDCASWTQYPSDKPQHLHTSLEKQISCHGQLSRMVLNSLASQHEHTEDIMLKNNVVSEFHLEWCVSSSIGLCR